MDAAPNLRLRFKRKHKLLFFVFSNSKPTGPESVMVRASASGAGGRGFDPESLHTNDVKMTVLYTLLAAQHYKASTGFSSPKKYSTSNGII